MKSVCCLLACGLALLPLVSAVPIPFYNCGTPSDHIQIINATADTWPPVAGTHVMITLAAVLDESLTGGAYSAQVTLDGLQLINQQGSLANLPGITYPIPAGPMTIAKRAHFPALLGGSSATLNISATDPNGQELLCIGIGIYIEPASSSEDDPDWVEKDQEDDESLFGPSVAVRPHARKHAAKSFQSAVLALIDLLAAKYNQHTDSIASESAVTTGVSVAVPVTNCGSPSDLLVLQSVTSTQWPPAAGTTATVIGSFTAAAEISAGSYTAVVSVDGFPVINTNGALADFLTLPILAGPMVIEKNLTMPASLPFSGAVSIKVNAQDSQSQEIFCFALAFTI